jgi:hypothetical protein
LRGLVVIVELKTQFYIEVQREIVFDVQEVIHTNSILPRQTGEEVKGGVQVKAFGFKNPHPGRHKELCRFLIRLLLVIVIFNIEVQPGTDPKV